MTRNHYADVAADAPQAMRTAEGIAFDRVLTLLERAKDGAAEPARDALDGLDRLWSVLLHDLAQPANALPDALKAQLVSIGLWVMREVSAIRMHTSRDFDGLIAVNAAIRAGLR